MEGFIDFKTIKSLALELGFQDCGAIKPSKIDISFFSEWLNKGYNAEMQYMGNYIDKRESPSLLLENSKSIISFIVSYNIETIDNKANNSLKFASYSLFEDYHKSIKAGLFKLISCIQDIYPNFKAIPYVDSAPLFEKLIAQKAGLGWIGKNSCLINKDYGSKILIGEIITNYSTNYNTIIQEDNCKECSNCINICPNQAIRDNKSINANLCSAYQTIENKGNIPNNINLKDYIFGCDICLNSCPWNNKNKIKASRILSLNPNMQNIIDEINKDNLDKTLFNKAKKNSSIERIKFEKLISNIQKAKGE
jgi:epoxyqueuosine reductase